MKDQLQKLLEERVRLFVSSERSKLDDGETIERKKASCAHRGAEIVKTKAAGRILRKSDAEGQAEVFYTVHFQHLIRQKGSFFLEETVEQRKADFYKNILVADREVSPQYEEKAPLAFEEREPDETDRPAFKYDRLKAVQYAERWWNDFNPAYKSFDVDCTNYISQCLHAGGAAMHGYPNRTGGWWMKKENWSFSWTVANSMRWYLASSKAGLKAREVESAAQLEPGDVICYDFQGDGRFDHTTFVTGRDANGMPLVNAHTANSRNRYWAYEDSTAYTPKIQYKFFAIVEDQ